MKTNELRQIVTDFEHISDNLGIVKWSKQPIDNVFKTLYAKEDSSYIISIQNVPVWYKTDFEDVSILDYENPDMVNLKTVFEITNSDNNFIEYVDPDNEENIEKIVKLINKNC